jgi:hypothetical protein
MHSRAARRGAQLQDLPVRQTRRVFSVVLRRPKASGRRRERRLGWVVSGRSGGHRSFRCGRPCGVIAGNERKARSACTRRHRSITAAALADGGYEGSLHDRRADCALPPAAWVMQRAGVNGGRRARRAHAAGAPFLSRKPSRAKSSARRLPQSD